MESKFKSYAGLGVLTLAFLLAGLLLAGCTQQGYPSPSPSASPTATIYPSTSPTPTEGLEGFSIVVLKKTDGTYVNPPALSLTGQNQFDLTFDVASEMDCPYRYWVTAAVADRLYPSHLTVMIKRSQAGIGMPCRVTPAVTTLKLHGLLPGATDTITVKMEDDDGTVTEVASVKVSGSYGGSHELTLERVNDSNMKPNDATLRFFSSSEVELTAALWAPTPCSLATASWTSSQGQVDVTFKYMQPTDVICTQVLEARTYRTKFDLMPVISSGAVRSIRVFNNGELVKEFSFTGMFCGGIAAMRCPYGYYCKLDGTYPDAGGKCVFNATVYTH